MSAPLPPVVMLDVAGTALTDDDRECLSNPATGGLILFSRNYTDRTQLSALIAEIRAVRPDILIAVDQEGGRVQRFRDGFVRLPPMAALGKQYDQHPQRACESATLLGELMATELVELDIDISFAPVLDLDYGQSSVIGDRSFHGSVAGMVALAGRFIDGMASAGMAATGKHFPGHGHVAADSHLALPEDERDFDSLWATDIQPFAALAPRLAGIMPAHVLYHAVDAQPAGFSEFWLQDVLRQRLGFRGVIFSDDLTMVGAHGVGNMATRVGAAFSAGCDMVLVCNDRTAALEALAAVEAMDMGAFKQRVAVQALRAKPRAPMAVERRHDAERLASELLGTVS